MAGIFTSSLLVSRISLHRIPSLRKLLTPPPEIAGQPMPTNTEYKKVFFEQVLQNTTGEFRPTEELIKARTDFLPLLPKSSSELTPRRMLDSYLQCIVPLTDDYDMRAKFINSRGMVHIGRVLEEIDYFAVAILYKHLLFEDERLNKVTPFAIATAKVEDTCIHGIIPSDRNLKAYGHVSWVGTSSAEVLVGVDYASSGETWSPCLTSRFILVARDVTGSTKAFLNPLLVETDEERAIFEDAERKKKLRTRAKQTSVYRTVPSQTELALVHRYFGLLRDHHFKDRPFCETVETPEGCIMMKNAVFKDNFHTVQEDSNIFNTVFGGYLMYKAYSMGWLAAYAFAQHRPFCLYMTDIEFKKPLLVGDVVFVKATVCYTENNMIQVRVTLETKDLELDQVQLVDSLYYTFKVPSVETLPTLVPETYREAMIYLQGRRRFNEAHGRSSPGTIPKVKF